MSLTKYKNWSHSDNFKFLSVWNDMKHSLKTNHANKASVYYEFKSRLKAVGVERSVCQIKKKISNFKEGFKKFAPPNDSTSSTWPYYDGVAQILGVKPQHESIVCDHALDSWPLATSSALIMSSQSSLGLSQMFKQELPERSWNNSLTVNVSSDNDTSIGEDVSQHISPIGGNSCSTQANLSRDATQPIQSNQLTNKSSNRENRSKDDESDCSEQHHQQQQPRKKARSCQSLNTLCIDSSSDDNSESSFITPTTLSRTERTIVSRSDRKLVQTYKRLLDESNRQCEEYRDKYMEQLNETGKYVNQLMEANKKIVELNKCVESAKRKQLCVNCIKECKH